MIEHPADILKFFDVVHWLHGKWVPDIIIALWDGPKRYNELFQLVQESGIPHGWSTQRGSLRKWPYAQTIERLEREGVIIRIEDDSVNPNAVFYDISQLFREFLDYHASGVIAWATRFEDLIADARRSREEAHAREPEE